MGLSADVLQYLRDHSVSEHPVQQALRDVTAEMEQSMMQISPEQGNFMQFMVQLTGARKCLEVGVFTGYSSLSVALALPDDGIINAFDISEEWTSIGKEHWRRAGVDHKINLSLGPAVDGLDALIAAGESGTYDFAFIDADKENYHNYYERCLTLLRSGGLILIDNVLWSGKVVDATFDDPETSAIRAINSLVANDHRVDKCMVPLSDGITMVRKR